MVTATATRVTAVAQAMATAAPVVGAVARAMATAVPVAGAAARVPQHVFLGIEVSHKYARFTAARLAKRQLTNAKVLDGDAVQIFAERLPAASAIAVHVYFPDPWWKKRHHKRRFLRMDTTDHLSRTLRPTGLLHVATDHVDYWESIEPLFDGHPDFERLGEFGGPEFPLPVDGSLTNYEEKYLKEGRRRFRASWRKRTNVMP